MQERYPSVARCYTVAYDLNNAGLIAAFDPGKHAKAEHLNGYYLLKTNSKDLLGDQLWCIYVLLTRAENAFRDMKSPLAERPVFNEPVP